MMRSPSCTLRAETEFARGAIGDRFRSSALLMVIALVRDRTQSTDSCSFERPITCARALDLRREHR